MSRLVADAEIPEFYRLSFHLSTAKIMIFGESQQLFSKFVQQILLFADDNAPRLDGDWLTLLQILTVKQRVTVGVWIVHGHRLV